MILHVCESMMHLRVLNTLIFCGLISCFAGFKFDMNGWDALPLTTPKIADSFKAASGHIGGSVTKKLTGFKRRDTIREWDIYRVSFLTVLPGGKDAECHADVLWSNNYKNTTVYNLGCLPGSVDPVGDAAYIQNNVA